MSAELLRASFLDAKTLISFLEEVRGPKNDLSGKYNFRLKDLRGIFSKDVWTDTSDPGGHTKLKHKITGVVINYSNHKDPVDPGAMASIVDKVQEHVNILGNDIFSFNKRNFKEAPDFEKIARKLRS
jgi:hypothetical protein